MRRVVVVQVELDVVVQAEPAVVQADRAEAQADRAEVQADRAEVQADRAEAEPAVVAVVARPPASRACWNFICAVA
jgi:hypothetical protein